MLNSMCFYQYDTKTKVSLSKTSSYHFKYVSELKVICFLTNHNSFITVFVLSFRNGLLHCQIRVSLISGYGKQCYSTWLM